MAMGPVLVRWPEQAPQRAAAADAGRPCLLAVEPGASLPVIGPLEDWIASNADERDVAARLDALTARAARTHRRSPRVVPIALDSDSDATAALPRAARILISRADALVPRRELIDGETADAELDRIIERARPVLRSHGYTVHRVGHRGFLATRTAAS